MMTSEMDSQCRVIDGVRVQGAPLKVGPFYHYQSFTVDLSDGGTVEFYANKIYRVKTIGKIGYANLKTIFVNEKTSKCFARFLLFHLPEDTKAGSQAWRHGQDELMKFSHIITIRCARTAFWTMPRAEENHEGTRSFNNSDVEQYRNGSVSLIRLKKNARTCSLGQYSVFAANAKLAAEKGIDLSKANFVPCVTQERWEETNISKMGQTEEEGREDSEEMLESTSQDSTAGVISSEEGADLDGNLAGQSEDVTDCQFTGDGCSKRCKKQAVTASTRLTRSCKSVYRSCCKRMHGGTVADEIAQESLRRLGNDDDERRGVAVQRKRGRDMAWIDTAADTVLEGERDCKIKVLSYNEYTAFKRREMGLKAGLIMDKQVAIANEAISNDGQSYRIYFMRTSFSDKEILRSALFERTAERKCQFGKKRKSKTEGKQLVRQESCVSEAYCFREDNWKEISEDLYFESVGYQRASQREGFRLNRNLIDQG